MNTSPTQTILERAREHHAAIRANVDDLYAKRITFTEFRRRSALLHEASRADGSEVEAALGELILAGLPGRRTR